MELELNTVPGYSTYSVTRSGKVYNVKKDKYLKGSIGNSGYLNFRLRNDDGVTKTIGLHRILAIVFIPDNRDITSLMVNHIDGNKKNNTIDNLEWVTNIENIEHAGALGLTSKCIPMEVKDYKSGKIYSFTSAVKCARYFKVSKDYVLHRLKRPTEVFSDHRQYKSIFSPHKWYDELPSKLNTGNSKAILVRNYETGNIKRYESSVLFSKQYNIVGSVVTTMIQKYDQPMINESEQFKLDDGLKWNIVKHPLFTYLSQGSDTRAVIVVDNGKQYYYDSLTSCANTLGIKLTTLHYRLKKYDGKEYSDGKYYSYLSTFIKGPFNQ